MTLTDTIFFYAAIVGMALSILTICRVFLILLDRAGRWF